MNAGDALRPLGSSPRNRWHVGGDRVLPRPGAGRTAPGDDRRHGSRRHVRPRPDGFDRRRHAERLLPPRGLARAILGSTSPPAPQADRTAAPLAARPPRGRGSCHLAELGQSPGSAEPQSRAPARLQSDGARASGSATRFPSPAPRCSKPAVGPRAVVDELVSDPADIHVAKYRMSGFPDTPLDSILRNLRVTTLLFAGVNLDQCVLCTLQDANFLGLRLPVARRLRRDDIAGLLYPGDTLQYPPVLRLRDGRTGASRTDLIADEQDFGGRLGRPP